MNFVLYEEALPRITDVADSEKENLFMEKLNLCCTVFDFTTNPRRNLKEKDMKQQTLLELLDYVKSSTKEIFSIIILRKITKMLSINLFRTLPSSLPPREEYYNNIVKLYNGLEKESPSTFKDPAWPHLRLVYEFLLKLLKSPRLDAKLATRYIDSSFVLKLFDLFDSEDYGERVYLYSIVIVIHEKLVIHQPLIMKALKNIFCCFVFETEKHNGISELLLVLVRMISEFVLPWKEEHKLFLVRTLIPLYKPQCIAMYHDNLTLCIILILGRDCKLVDTIILGMLKYWPIKNSLKEFYLLNDLQRILQAAKPEELKSCIVPMFCQIGRCLTSAHMIVADLSLRLLLNGRVMNLIKWNQKVVLPIILIALEKTARSHWKQAVQELARDVGRTLFDIDPELFKECLLKFLEEEAQEMEIKLKRKAIWKRLEKIALSNESGVSSKID